MIVLDTHAWIWWVSNPEKLSKAARESIEKAREKNEIYVSSISAWEVAMLVERDRLKLTMGTEDWIDKSEALPWIVFIPVSNRIAVKSVHLPGRFHSDPADRIIIATALDLGTPVVTKDDKFHTYKHIKAIW